MDWVLIALIISLIANVFGIPFIILKSIDIIKKWRYEKKAKTNDIEVKFLDFVGKLSYTTKGISPNTIRICHIKLNFDVKNLGSKMTTVKIFEAKFKVLGIDNKEYIAQNLAKSIHPVDLDMRPLKIDIKANGKESNHLNFQTIGDSSYFKEAWIKLKYKFLDINADYITEETDWEVVEIRNFQLI